jgi:hypothetical protein
MPLTIKHFNQASRTEFEQTFAQILEQLDIYYQPGFLACDAHMQGGHYELFTVTSGQGVWIYPYVKRPIADTHWIDISSPYGYAGPYCNDPALFERAEKEFLDYSQTQNVVTEFVRYHYLYNENIGHRFKHNIVNLENRTLVLLDTTQAPQTIWEKSFSTTNRNLVRKLQKEGYQWHWRTFQESDISAFSEMYKATMNHAQATDFYYFDTAFYQELIQELGDKLKIAAIEKAGVVFGTALFFLSGKILTYYLSARNLDFPKVTASNLLLSQVSLWAAENGFECVNFGGGLTDDAEDRLYKFKRNFSPTTQKFYIGKRIHHAENYRQLIDEYIQNNGAENYAKVKHILQFYR